MDGPINVIIELSYSQALESNYNMALDGNFKPVSNQSVPKLDGYKLDKEFPAVALPSKKENNQDDENKDAKNENLFDTTAGESYDLKTEKSTYIVRGTVAKSKLNAFVKDANSKKNVINVFSDPQIASHLTCVGDAPVGSDSDVETLLKVTTLKKCKMDGAGVRVAIVDTGVNMAYLNSKGKSPNFDLANSWKPATAPATQTPGSFPVSHGTMCAYDACIAAPKCTILDIALLTSQVGGGFSGFLSDAILAYRHLIDVINQPVSPGMNKSLVVNNSWGMFHPSWDFPVGTPQNYSDNPNHPFNRIVRTLEREGADILFAAGNCGSECPDGRCQGVVTSPIYGANSSPYVLSVAGADITNLRVGYSSKGPGRLENKKPDITGYTHFRGSGVYAADGGTSAACPVVAGVVAAIRSIRPLNLNNPITRPSAIRNLVTSTAIDVAPTGYDYSYGYGIIDSAKIAAKICKSPFTPVPVPFPLWCKKYPWLCKHPWFCRRYPQLCFPRPPFPRPPFPRPPFPSPIPPRSNMTFGSEQDASLEEGHLNYDYQMFSDGGDLSYSDDFLMGVQFVLQQLESQDKQHPHDDCNCGK